MIEYQKTNFSFSIWGYYHGVSGGRRVIFMAK